MSATLTLLLIVVAAYLAAHVAFEWLARRFLVVSGAEYLLLGVLLGPSVANFIRPGVVGDFAPLMTLALGWIGAVVGAQFFLPALVRIPAIHFRVAFAEAVLSLAVVSAGMWGLIVLVFRLDPITALLPATTLGAIATASAPTGIALMSRVVGRRNDVVRQLAVTTGVDALVAILAFGLLLALVHESPPTLARPLTPTEWAVISLAIGVVGGALFHLFLGGEREIDRLFVALSGALILASGAAAYLRLTPLLPAMLIGAILVNTSRNRAEITEVLGRVERPLYFVLLVFAGAAWEPGTTVGLLVVAAFLAVRMAGKLGAAWAGAALSGAVDALGAGWGRALFGHGGLAVAIALNYRLHDGAVLSEAVFTAALVSVVLTDLLSARLAEPVMRPVEPAEDASPADRGVGAATARES